jgi:predicted lipoprotein with Yx(FWY)xxD motif
MLMAVHTLRLSTKGTPVSISRSLPWLATAGVIPLVVLAIVGCGGGDEGAASAAPPKTASGRPATLGVADTGLGKILVDSQGRTLYLFAKDAGTRSACAGACASAWPPLRTSGRPTVGTEAKRSVVGTTTRSDGDPQVTYDGHPLYLYEGDRKPGDINGHGLTDFGAAWFALSPAGRQVSELPSSRGGDRPSYDGRSY